jgi:hypothetical protein
LKGLDVNGTVKLNFYIFANLSYYLRLKEGFLEFENRKHQRKQGSKEKR